MWHVIFFLLIAFVGYAIGRIGHVLGGHLNTPDHWIYGMLAILVGASFYKHGWAVWLIAFGVGHTFSDLKDMLRLKFYGPDDTEVRKFWGID
jgi:hypothetical protein